MTLGCTCVHTHIDERWTAIVALEDVKNCEASIMNNSSVNTTFSNISNELSDKFVELCCCSCSVLLSYQNRQTMDEHFHKQLFRNTYEYILYFRI